MEAPMHPSLPMIRRAAILLLIAAAVASPAQAEPYAGLKKTVAVDTFQAAEGVGGSVTADGLTSMLTEALIKDGRFVVVERPGLASVQNEQAIGMAGQVNAETAAKAGKLIGASAIIRGAVIKYEANAKGGSVGVAGFSMGSLFGSQATADHKEAVLVIQLRLIDTTTGQVISTSTAEGTASSTGVGANVVSMKTGVAAGGNLFKNSPIGEAAEEAIQKGVEQIAAGMRNVPWSASIVDASDKIYVGAGTDRNVTPGMTLNVYRTGRVLTDPGTGETLDVAMDKVATITIDGVREKFSTATLVSGNMPMRGDICKKE
ncbi:MAG: hypothetical protein GC166_06425 [Alphaproteobacteria bacterium]|nr:hypothetical protein [Alphaproteobacteria bacterium]